MKKENRLKTVGFTACCIFILFLVVACAARYNRYGLPQNDYEYQIPQQLDDGWQTSSLEEQRVESGKIMAMVGKIMAGNIDNIHGIVIVKNGKLIFEEYFDGFDRGTKHHIFSASKSVTSILIGIAMDQKKLSGVGTQVYELLPDYKGTLWIDQRYDIKLKHVLTMTAGLDWSGWDYPGYDTRSPTRQMFVSNNWVKFVLDRKTSDPPGSRFIYNNGLTILLGEIVKKSTGMDADKFAENNLFAPLGITDYSWRKGPNGALDTAGGLSLKPRDMAKIGYLFLKNGQWNGEQIVSQKWVTESVKNHADQHVTFGSGYGYQWWCGRSKINGQMVGTFYAAGHGGQYIFVCPVLNSVTVVTSKWIGNPLGEFRPQMLLVNFILPAMVPPSSSKVINPAPSILDKYAGEYEFSKWNLKATVRRQGDRLYIDLPKSSEKEVWPVAENQFLYPLKGYGDVRLEFTSGSPAEITQMVAYFGYANIPFKKRGK
jgi:CubicO group peptidase (beta-lactamase class C family)